MQTPSVWDVSATIQLIQTIGSVLATVALPIVLALLAMNKKQNDRIETLTNGNLHKSQTENKELRARLDAHGIDHTDV